MKTINTFISEKLKVNKDVKSEGKKIIVFTDWGGNIPWGNKEKCKYFLADTIDEAIKGIRKEKQWHTAYYIENTDYIPDLIDLCCNFDPFEDEKVWYKKLKDITVTPAREDIVKKLKRQ